MTGIAQMFRELDGRDRYEMQLELWSWRQRARKAEIDRDWKRANPGKVYAYVKAWRKRRPDLLRAQRKRSNASRLARMPERVAQLKREAQKRKRAKRPEHYRELNRKNQAARRARLKALVSNAA